MMIEISDLTFAYARQATPVFEGFTWRVERGDAWAVIGPSGCGKSTLLYLIAGLRRPVSGSVTVAGEDAAARSNRGRVGLVLQDYGLLPWATAWDNARLGLRIRRFYGKPVDGSLARLSRWLARLGLAGLQRQYPGQLSGGERQRVAIARALALEPEVLLLDEPFSALDALVREDLERLTVRLWAENSITTVFVTHSIEEAVFVGKRILVLHTPPNRRAMVIANPSAGTSDYQRQAEYLVTCNELRAALAGEACKSVSLSPAPSRFGERNLAPPSRGQEEGGEG